MTAFIGLTKGFWTKYNALLEGLRYIGISTINEAEQVCTPQEMRIIHMAQNYWDKPQNRLTWDNVRAVS